MQRDEKRRADRGGDRRHGVALERVVPAPAARLGDARDEHRAQRERDAERQPGLEPRAEARRTGPDLLGLVPELGEQLVAPAPDLVEAERAGLGGGLSSGTFAADHTVPPVGLQDANHLLDFQVRRLHRPAQVLHFVVVEHAEFFEATHVRVLCLPSRHLVVLLDNLREGFHVEGDVGLEHVDGAV